MKNVKYILNCILFAMVVTFFTACNKDIEIPGGPLNAYDKVYMPAAARNPNVVNLKLIDSTYQVVYGAAFGGYGYPEQDIHVQFAVKPALADSFNLTNNTTHTLLPEGSYTISQTSSVILKGKLNTDPLIVTINPLKANLVKLKKYILPVSLSVVEGGVAVNEDLSTAYYVFQAK